MQENRTMQQPMQNIQNALGDNQIANNLRQQAMKMAAEAKGLLAESDRLMKEAAQMDPSFSINEQTVPSVAAKRRGRPAKVKVAA